MASSTAENPREFLREELTLALADCGLPVVPFDDSESRPRLCVEIGRTQLTGNKGDEGDDGEGGGGFYNRATGFGVLAELSAAIGDNRELDTALDAMQHTLRMALHARGSAQAQFECDELSIIITGIEVQDEIPSADYASGMGSLLILGAIHYQESYHG